MKKKLTSSPILQFPDWNKKFWIETNASNLGLGAALTQWHWDQGKQVQLPVAYASRMLKNAEKNYSTIDKEGLAVIWAIKQSKTYVMGMHFKIITDYSALKVLQSKAILEGRLLQWAEYLMGYDFHIV